METKNKVKIVKTALFVEGTILILFGLFHCIFPREAHIVMEQHSFDINNPWMRAAVYEMGALFFVFGLAAVKASTNPLKYRYLIFFIVLAGVLSDIVRSSAVFFYDNSPRLLLIAIVSVILWLAIIIFYPYQELKKVE